MGNMSEKRLIVRYDPTDEQSTRRSNNWFAGGWGRGKVQTARCPTMDRIVSKGDPVETGRGENGTQPAPWDNMFPAFGPLQNSALTKACDTTHCCRT